jgi:hypothetical protein
MQMAKRGSAMSQVRKSVTGWLEQYRERSSSSPEEIEALHELLEGMTDRQLGKFLEWLAARGELEEGWSVSSSDDSAGSDSRSSFSGSVGWGLPRLPKRGREERVTVS